MFPLPLSTGDDDEDDSDDGPLQAGTQLADGNVDAELVSEVVSCISQAELLATGEFLVS